MRWLLSIFFFKARCSTGRNFLSSVGSVIEDRLPISALHSFLESSNDVNEKHGVALLASVVHGKSQLIDLLVAKGGIISGTLWLPFNDHPNLLRYAVKYQPDLFSQMDPREALRAAATTGDIGFLLFASENRLLRRFMSSLSSGAYGEEVVAFLRSLGLNVATQDEALASLAKRRTSASQIYVRNAKWEIQMIDVKLPTTIGRVKRLLGYSGRAIVVYDGAHS